MSMPAPALVALLNKASARERVIAHMVPTRVIRIVGLYAIGDVSIADDICDTAGFAPRVEYKCNTFRVEQLIEHGGFGTHTPRGEWRTLTTHHHDTPGAALGAAFDAAMKAQKDLIYKLRKKMVEQQQATRGL
jgi:hypothetical protein